MSLARGIQQLLRDLQDRCQKAVLSTDRSGLRKPAHTIVGKLEQAQRWLANPVVDDKGLGEYDSNVCVLRDLYSTTGAGKYRSSFTECV